ncbi:MAG TPA: hypothetical protein ENK15_03585, partial [Thermopetrobacter sp.]|nr:hypothetical protein [Thermopetrobacter sp.]
GHARIVLASVIEAIHTASLLHDDVVDSAELSSEPGPPPGGNGLSILPPFGACNAK